MDLTDKKKDLLIGITKRNFKVSLLLLAGCIVQALSLFITQISNSEICNTAFSGMIAMTIVANILGFVVASWKLNGCKSEIELNERYNVASKYSVIAVCVIPVLRFILFFIF